MWEFTNSSYLGESWSEPVIGKVRIAKSAWSSTGYPTRDRWVAVFGGGASVDNVANSLIVLDIATGTPLKVFDEASGIDNNLVASPTMLLDASGYIKFVYVADLDGSLYKFDFRTAGLESTGYSEWGVKKIFQASSTQPVYHRAEPGVVSEAPAVHLLRHREPGGPVSEIGSAGTGKFYAVKDTDLYGPPRPLTEAGLANLTGNLTGGTAAPRTTVGSSICTRFPPTPIRPISIRIPERRSSRTPWYSTTTSISRRSPRTVGPLRRRRDRRGVRHQHDQTPRRPSIRFPREGRPHQGAIPRVRREP